MDLRSVCVFAFAAGLSGHETTMKRSPSIDENWRRSCAVLALVMGLCLANELWAESGFLVVTVEDVHKHPVGGVEIGVEGDGGSAVTDDHGKARIRLAAQNKPKDWISLQILKSPPGKDLVMVSPWDSRTLVPSFENESENFVKVVVVEFRDRAALEDGAFVAALTAKIIKANAPKTAEKELHEEDPKANVAAVAKRYGLDPEELDKAIRSWGEKTIDPYEAGLAALYQRNYPSASAQLKESLQNREGVLAVDQKAVADAAFFLGQSLYEEGKYKESAVAYQRCIQLKQDDTTVMNNLGSVLQADGDYAQAELMYRQALAIREKALGPDHVVVANSLNNLASLLQAEGDYVGAEPLYRRALAIEEKALGPDHPYVAVTLNNLASLLQAEGDYAGAEPLYRRALAIDEKALGPDHPDVARCLNNLALLLQAKGDYVRAESMYRRALAIDEKALGPDHPYVATCLNNLALLLKAKGDYASAEPLYRQALAIQEKALGPDHPDVALSLNNLALLLKAKGDYASAEPMYDRALAIREKALGPDHPDVAVSLNNLASLLQAEGDYASAEPLYRRALAIDERALGREHPQTKALRFNLQVLIDKQSTKQEEK
jgi:tetratricopeptide (TPR) repeat protein